MPMGPLSGYTPAMESKELFLFCAIDYFLSATLVFPAEMLSMGVFICVSVSLNHNRS